MEDKRLEATARLLDVMTTLRRECPWDREQTFDSLRSNTIEETYELADAITDHNMEGIKEELGDLLLHVVFYSKLGEEAGAFDYADVANALCDKLVYRHPHVYGDIHANTPDQVKENWEALKLRKKNRKSGTLGGVPRSLPALVKAFRVGEKAAATGFDWQKREDVWDKVKENWEALKLRKKNRKSGTLGGVPRSLPALVKAFRVGEKAAATGFDWQKREDVWDKVKEETAEVEAEMRSGDKANLEAEFGDLFFALVNAARLYGVDPESALERTNKKFIRRFNYMEEQAAAQGNSLHDLSLGEMEALWQEAKKGE